MTIEEIAEICHEANRRLCKQQGDFSQVDWNDAPEWQRESAVKGVRFHLDHPEATAAASHESWLEEKRDGGWQYGEVKDAEKKTHPCFVEYEKLPREQQAKDYLFKAIVGGLRDFV
mgnify:CR=1 FL=1